MPAFADEDLVDGYWSSKRCRTLSPRGSWNLKSLLMTRGEGICGHTCKDIACWVSGWVSTEPKRFDVALPVAAVVAALVDLAVAALLLSRV
jgi:hypothetical protein